MRFCTSTWHAGISATATTSLRPRLMRVWSPTLPGCVLYVLCTMLSREARILLGILNCCGAPGRFPTLQSTFSEAAQDGGARAGVPGSCHPVKIGRAHV